VAALTIAACGGDEETTSAEEAALPPLEAGPAAFMGCLLDAGYDASVDDPITGIDAPHVNIVMALNTLDQGAEFAVFDSIEEAEANAEDVAALMGVSPTETTANVVWGFDASADETPADVRKVELCLPQTP
jgi:hypothetical protein